MPRKVCGRSRKGANPCGRQSRVAQPKTIDQFAPDDEIASYEIHVSEEMNRKYLEAVEDTSERYTEVTTKGGQWVHPSILLNQSNPTRSASHVLPPGMGHVHAKDEVTFSRPGRVGTTFHVQWRVLERYTKRDRPYTVFECRVLDDEGAEVLIRRMTSTWVQGQGSDKPSG